MERRDFFTTLNPLDSSGDELKSSSGLSFVFSGEGKKDSPRILSGLEKYTGQWSSLQARHLLSRACFGGKPEEISNLVSNGLDGSITSIFGDVPNPAPPIDPTNGNSWVSLQYDSMNDYKYSQYLKSWWMGLIINSNPTILEKMTLFWHGHFVTEYNTVRDARYMYSQNELFRQNALGNVKTLVKEISKNPAMLRYLNGNTNVVGKPNENYGRELLELFTIGKGIEIEPGNYTNYTEDDVKAAAKVLTGWQDDKANIVGIFNQKLHDTNDKKFSSAFNNTVIKGRTGTNAGTDELNDLVEMIFAQKETARFLIRKLYHWYIFYEIDEITETNFIEPLADMLINGNYEIKPVLESMLSSAHFFESNNISVHIKNPVDFIAQTVRTFGLPVPDISKDYAAYYTLNQQLMNYSLVFQMNLFDPPDVAGWKAYYQVPDFYQLWLNTVTLPYRNGFTDQLLNIKPFNKSFIIDIIGLVQKRVSDPSDATIIVTELAEFMFILPLTQQELTYLVDNIFLPGLPLYEWTSEWNKYKQNPNDTKTKSLIISQLTQLVRFMFRMAEFQLH